VKGHLYVIRNPAWPTHVKVGVTMQLRARFLQYQTGTPFRDFEIVHTAEVENSYEVEHELKRRLADYREPRSEWYRIDLATLLPILSSLVTVPTEQP
jgi:hypothetical protein